MPITVGGSTYGRWFKGYKVITNRRIEGKGGMRLNKMVVPRGEAMKLQIEG